MKRVQADHIEDEDKFDAEDIYDEKERETMLDEDEITASEYAFMQGREMTKKRIKKNEKADHEDTKSVELAEDEYVDD
jgi:hypothetical protein